MNFSDIIPEAVLSVGKPCLVVHAMPSYMLHSFDEVKREIIRSPACTVLCFAYTQIHVSETQFACIPREDFQSARSRPIRKSVPQL